MYITMQGSEYVKSEYFPTLWQVLQLQYSGWTNKGVIIVTSEIAHLPHNIHRQSHIIFSKIPVFIHPEDCSLNGWRNV
jgi:hypothetical protein